MHVVTGAAGQGFEINARFFEALVLFQILAMTAATQCDLLVCILHRVSFNMNGVTSRAGDVLAVV